MGRERDLLLDSIRLVLAGNEARSDDVLAILPYPAALDRIEKAAWIALKSWRDDVELRASHSRLDRFVRQRLEDLSVSLVAARAGG